MNDCLTNIAFRFLKMLCRSIEAKGKVDPQEERKFIVFETNLLSLFAYCPICTGSAEARVLKEIGTLVKVLYWCTEERCKFTNVWYSQPFAKGKMPMGNLLLSSSILLSGKYKSIPLISIHG